MAEDTRYRDRPIVRKAYLEYRQKKNDWAGEFTATVAFSLAKDLGFTDRYLQHYIASRIDDHFREDGVYDRDLHPTIDLVVFDRREHEYDQWFYVPEVSFFNNNGAFQRPRWWRKVNEDERCLPTDRGLRQDVDVIGSGLLPVDKQVSNDVVDWIRVPWELLPTFAPLREVYNNKVPSHWTSWQTALHLSLHIFDEGNTRRARYLASRIHDVFSQAGAWRQGARVDRSDSYQREWPMFRADLRFRPPLHWGDRDTANAMIFALRELHHAGYWSFAETSAGSPVTAHVREYRQSIPLYPLPPPEEFPFGALVAQQQEEYPWSVINRVDWDDLPRMKEFRERWRNGSKHNQDMRRLTTGQRALWIAKNYVNPLYSTDELDYLASRIHDVFVASGEWRRPDSIRPDGYMPWIDLFQGTWELQFGLDQDGASEGDFRMIAIELERAAKRANGQLPPRPQRVSEPGSMGPPPRPALQWVEEGPSGSQRRRGSRRDEAGPSDSLSHRRQAPQRDEAGPSGSQRRRTPQRDEAGPSGSRRRR